MMACAKSFASFSSILSSSSATSFILSITVAVLCTSEVYALSSDVDALPYVLVASLAAVLSEVYSDSAFDWLVDSTVLVDSLVDVYSLVSVDSDAELIRLSLLTSL